MIDLDTSLAHLVALLRELNIEQLQQEQPTPQEDIEAPTLSLDTIFLEPNSRNTDIEKARAVLASFTAKNPKSPKAWIAAARLEEIAGDSVAARRCISKGYEQCPQSEAVWLCALQLEIDDTETKKALLRHALHHVQKSIELWQALVSLEEDQEQARTLLTQAVQFNPSSVELRLALARRMEFLDAFHVLQGGYQTDPTAVELWIAAAKLAETNGKATSAQLTIVSCFKTLFFVRGCDGVDLEWWIKEARACEEEGASATGTKIRESVSWIMELQGAEVGDATSWLHELVAAAQEKEHNRKEDMAETIIKRAFAYVDEKLVSKGVRIDSEWWLKEAMMCAKSGAAATREAIMSELGARRKDGRSGLGVRFPDLG
ncbi:hypothetical protein HK102_002882 [Quaeritorhiza haematococci]|nr:hypothetical protein HK102_002882 [Quaeritorhiza haematococci]